MLCGVARGNRRTTNSERINVGSHETGDGTEKWKLPQSPHYNHGMLLISRLLLRVMVVVEEDEAELKGQIG